MKTAKAYTKRWQPATQVVRHSKGRDNLNNTISILLIDTGTQKVFSVEMPLEEAREFGESLVALAA